MTYFVNVHQIPNDGRQFLGHAISDEFVSICCARPNAVYRLRITPKDGFTIKDVMGLSK